MPRLAKLPNIRNLQAFYWLKKIARGVALSKILNLALASGLLKNLNIDNCALVFFGGCLSISSLAANALAIAPNGMPLNMLNAKAIYDYLLKNTKVYSK